MKGQYRVAYRNNITHSSGKLRISKSDAFKLYYFSAGEGELRAFVNGKIIDLAPGQVLLVPEGSFTGIVKKQRTSYARCVSLFPGELTDFLSDTDPETVELLKTAALFTLEGEGLRAYGEIIDSASEKLKGIEALELILRQIRILAKSKRTVIDTRTNGRLLGSVLDVIERECLNLSSAEEIAAKVGYSKNYLCKHFKDRMNIGLHDFLIARKLFSALEMLSRGTSVTETAYACGFSGASHFISVFRAHYGTTPKKYISQIVEN